MYFSRLHFSAILGALVSPVVCVAQVPLPDLVRQVTPAVVSLKAYGEAGSVLAWGSGFFLQDGRIATNLHVVRGASRVEVFDHRERLLGAVDHASNLSATVDLAILPALGDMPATLRLASLEPAAGEPVFAVGSPQGLNNTVSEGIVSAVRTLEGRRLIQITSPISSGSSGGPVLNTAGEVIGVSVAQLQDGQNLNFAVPVRDLQMLSMSPSGRLPFPMSPTINSDGPIPQGISIASVLELFPALARDVLIEGSLSRGDLLLQERLTDFYRFTGQAGDTVTLVLSSDSFDVTVELGSVTEAGELSTLQTNDDGWGGTQAMIMASLPRDGVYLAVAGSYEAGATGPYKIAVFEGDLTALFARATEPATRDERWVRVAGNEAQQVFLDSRTIRPVGDGVVEVWLRTEFAENQRTSGNKNYDRTLNLWRYDCNRREQGVLEVTYYLNGVQIDAFDIRSVFEAQTWRPGTFGERVAEEVC